jgi:phospholipase C
MLSEAAANGISDKDPARTPIKHVVVIFQENVSFDHYFATYPFAANTDGSPFKPDKNTPKVNGLGTLINGEPDGSLLTNNPNATNPANGVNAINPFRLSQSQASTCDQDHNYGDEQAAFDQGLMDAFPLSVGVGGNSFCDSKFSYGKGNGLVMGYFDGNTVTALWNYAQHFAMSDNSYGTTFGPSTPGLLNLVAGNTYPAIGSASTPKIVNIINANGKNQGTLVGDLDPTGDKCSAGITVQMGGKNIGDLLNEQGISWGSFMGGFDLTIKNPDGSTGCARQSPATPANNGPTADYIPHHAFFQYWASTANPDHTRPTVPPSLYGTASDKANHEYDIHDFFDALKADNLPAVSFLKAPANMDGHAGYSDPLLEQQFIANTVNAIAASRFWDNTAIIISYDDSDGWYDHQMSNIVNSSTVFNSASLKNSDSLNAPGKCGNGTPLKDDSGNVIQGRCGYGPRLPLIVISPFAKQNFVDHTVTDQSSILRFIEDNWGTNGIGGGSFDDLAGGLDNMFDFNFPRARRLFVNPSTGLVVNFIDQAKLW